MTTVPSLSLADDVDDLVRILRAAHSALLNEEYDNARKDLRIVYNDLLPVYAKLMRVIEADRD